MCDRFWQLGIFFRVRHFPAIESQISEAADSVLSHRAVVAEAADRSYRNVLVIEDDAVFSRDILQRMRKLVDQFAAMKWQVISFGDPGELSDSTLGASMEKKGIRFSEPGRHVGTRAIVYDNSIYQTILDSLPGDRNSIAGWLKENGSLGSYLSQQKTAVLTPAVVNGE